jgi:hypothetical protein
MISLGMSLSMKLGLAVPLHLAALHAAPISQPAPAPMVGTGAVLSAAPLPAPHAVPQVSPKAPAPVATTTTTTTTTTPPGSVCTVTWSALPATDGSTGVSGTYPAGFEGSCAEAYAYAAVGGGIVTVISP